MADVLTASEFLLSYFKKKNTSVLKEDLFAWAREQSFWKFMTEEMLKSAFDFLVIEEDLVITKGGKYIHLIYPSSAPMGEAFSRHLPAK